MTTDPPFAARRYSLLVPWRDVTEILFTWKVGSHIELPDFATGTRRDNGAAVNIPRDCTVLHVDTDPMSRCFFIAICHPSFPIVPDGMKAPEITAVHRSAHMVVRDDGTIRDTPTPRVEVNAFGFAIPADAVVTGVEEVHDTPSIRDYFGLPTPAESDKLVSTLSRGPGRIGETTTCESCRDVIPLQEAATYEGFTSTQVLCQPCHNGIHLP